MTRVSKKEFAEIIKRAAQPLKSLEKKASRDSGANRNGKRTHQRNVEDTSEKQHDESR